MPSSSESGALTRRRRRRQPPRRCKRFRGNPGGGPFLMDIHEPVLRHILGFTMWEDEEVEVERSIALWKWTGDLSIVCRVFRRVARQVAPSKLFCTSDDDTSTSLLRSLQENPWKKTNLVEINIRSAHVIEGSLFPGLFLALFETPDAFPNLNKLTLKIGSLEPVDGFDGDFLFNLARSCPRLSELYMYFPTEPVSEDQFGSFGQMLRHPLHTLHLWSGPWMTGAHLGAFLRHQGQHLTDMELTVVSPTGTLIRPSADAWLVHAAKHCHNLEKFRSFANPITTGNWSSFLQANPSLRELDIAYTAHSGLLFIDMLIRHAPQLEKITVFSCRWFTDDLLDRLVQGQIDYWTDRSEQIRLIHINAGCTSVTRDGVDRVLAKPNVGCLEVQLLG